jgi:hypothetical protein
MDYLPGQQYHQTQVLTLKKIYTVNKKYTPTKPTKATMPNTTSSQESIKITP